MSRWLLIVGAAISAFSGVLSTETQAQWYGAVDFMAPRRSVNTNAVLQRGITTETVREVDVITSTTTVTLPDGGGTTTNVTEIPVRIHEHTELRVGAPLLTADDVDFGHNAAGRLTLGRRFGYFGIEASFLWTEAWDGSASVSDANGELVSPFVGPGILLSEHDYLDRFILGESETWTDYPELAQLNTFAEIDYESKLMTGDINALGVLIEGDRGTVTGLAGFRFTELEEHFGYSSTSTTLDSSIGIPSGTSPSQAVDVRNRLFGPQIGLMVVSPLTQRLFLTLSAKTALAYNRMERQTRWQPDVAVEDQITYRTRDSHASLLGDFSIGGNFFVTPNFAIKLGFDVLTIGDVALASDNFRTDIDRLGTSDIAIGHRSRANYYSPTIGALLTF